ncbi:Glycoside hydrolase family 31 protein [Mycena chlorophos]|uniref:Glycoside hydrolase family 31 protein n=1 Tax=Mycena chlorophos TaxID=658473 RepID=A0A8H6S026_MYCCL|nr:Glycoside hydrolase family 31 protein [Mycena chlorophos]
MPLPTPDPDSQALTTTTTGDDIESRAGGTELDGGGGWSHFSGDWRRIDYARVSWAYAGEADGPQPLRGLFFAPGPHDRHAELEKVVDDGDGDSGRLNVDLVGFKGALDVLEPYEVSVGFYWPEAPARLSNGDHHVADAKAKAKEWDELVQDLTGGFDFSVGATPAEAISDDDSTSTSALSVHRSTSTHSSMDLTDSDRSVSSIPMPSTPRASRRSYANILVKNGSSPSRSRDSDRSPMRLNAGASIFVPSPAKPKPKQPTDADPISFPTLNPSSRAPSPSFNAAFVFPSLDVHVPPIPSVKITKDDQGFYSEVTSSQPRATPTPVVPQFLQERPRRSTSSKTRAMVDKLKSSGPQQQQQQRPQLQLSALMKPRLSISEYGGDGETPGTDNDSEGGWIGGEDGHGGASTKLSPAAAIPKTRRSRDLFLALNRRRSNSSPVKPSLIGDDNDDEMPVDEVAAPVTVAVELPSPSSTLSTSSSSSTNDNEGWIVGSASAKSTSTHTPPAVQKKPRPPKIKRQSASGITPPSNNHAHSNSYSRVAVPPPPPQPQPFFYPGPHAQPVAVPVPYAAAAYMQQMHMHLQLQQQMQQQQAQQAQQHHMRRVSAPVASSRSSRGTPAGSGDWRPGHGAFAVPAYPIPVAVPISALHHPPPLFVPHTHAS